MGRTVWTEIKTTNNHSLAKDGLTCFIEIPITIGIQSSVPKAFKILSLNFNAKKPAISPA